MPLLALGTDEVTKLHVASQEFGSVEFFHVDKYLEVPAKLDTIALQNQPKVQQALLRTHSKLVHPAFCAMTGTFTKAHADSLYSLLGFVIPPTGVQLGSPSDFSKCGITIKYSVSDNFTTNAIKLMLAELKEGEHGSIKGICYCNPKKDIE
eukprot:scaffold273768_cov31-Attheya_sp.AAC.1